MIIFLALISLVFSADFSFQPRLYLCQLFLTDNQKFFVEFLQKNFESNLLEKEITRKALFVNVLILESCAQNLSKLSNTQIAEMIQSLSVGKKTQLESLMFFDLTNINWKKQEISSQGLQILNHIKAVNRMNEQTLKLEILKFLHKFAKKFSMLQFLEMFFIQMGFIKILGILVAFGALLYLSLTVLQKSNDKKNSKSKNDRKFDEAMQEVNEIIDKKIK